ncbi:alpha/beta hydrolase [Paracoccaceae bacterium GXU_MW_L88]
MTTRRFFLQSGAMAAGLLGAGMSVAQPVLEPVTLDLLRSAHPTHRFDDRLVETSGGRRYRLFRAIPKAAPPEAGWPALWLTDGNAVFDRLPPDLLAAHPGLVVIGIGYDTDLPFETTARALDYTPPPLRPDPRRAERQVGGADAFLARIDGPLRAEAERGLSIDASRRTLAGHSYGGLFALYARARGASFTQYGAISPSLWLAPDLEPGGTAPLTILVGDAERGAEGGAPEDTRRFIAQGAGQRIRVILLPGLSHGATLAGALPELMAIASVGHNGAKIGRHLQKRPN